MGSLEKCQPDERPKQARGTREPTVAIYNCRRTGFLVGAGCAIADLRGAPLSYLALWWGGWRDKLILGRFGPGSRRRFTMNLPEPARVQDPPEPCARTCPNLPGRNPPNQLDSTHYLRSPTTLHGLHEPRFFFILLAVMPFATFGTSAHFLLGNLYYLGTNKEPKNLALATLFLKFDMPEPTFTIVHLVASQSLKRQAREEQTASHREGVGQRNALRDKLVEQTARSCMTASPALWHGEDVRRPHSATRAPSGTNRAASQPPPLLYRAPPSTTRPSTASPRSARDIEHHRAAMVRAAPMLHISRHVEASPRRPASAPSSARSRRMPPATAGKGVTTVAVTSRAPTTHMQPTFSCTPPTCEIRRRAVASDVASDGSSPIQDISRIWLVHGYKEQQRESARDRLQRARMPPPEIGASEEHQAELLYQLQLLNAARLMSASALRDPRAPLQREAASVHATKRVIDKTIRQHLKHRPSSPGMRGTSTATSAPVSDEPTDGANTVAMSPHREPPAQLQHQYPSAPAPSPPTGNIALAAAHHLSSSEKGAAPAISGGRFSCAGHREPPGCAVWEPATWEPATWADPSAGPYRHMPSSQPLESAAGAEVAKVLAEELPVVVEEVTDEVADRVAEGEAGATVAEAASAAEADGLHQDEEILQGSITRDRHQPLDDVFFEPEEQQSQHERAIAKMSRTGMLDKRVAGLQAARGERTYSKWLSKGDAVRKGIVSALGDDKGTEVCSLCFSLALAQLMVPCAQCPCLQ